MRDLKFALCLLLLSLPFTALAQQSKVQEKPLYVVIPPERALLTVASQPDCPLRLENARLLYKLNDQERPRVSYGVEYRNRGAKPIVGFSVVAWTNYGTGGTLSGGWAEKRKVLMPGQSVGYSDEENQQIIPLTDELRDRLKLRGPMQVIHILVVEEVYFADGSAYKDKKTSEALLKYFEFLEAHPGGSPES